MEGFVKEGLNTEENLSTMTYESRTSLLSLRRAAGRGFCLRGRRIRTYHVIPAVLRLHSNAEVDGTSRSHAED